MEVAVSANSLLYLDRLINSSCKSKVASKSRENDALIGVKAFSKSVPFVRRRVEGESG
jgi:hypothetical protein